MIYKFEVDQNLLVKNTVTGRPSSKKEAVALLEAGHHVIYRDKKSGKDLSHKLMAWLEGPDAPQFSDKMRSCKHCKRPTVNYYKCSDCWNLMHQDEICEKDDEL